MDRTNVPSQDSSVSRRAIFEPDPLHESELFLSDLDDTQREQCVRAVDVLSRSFHFRTPRQQRRAWHAAHILATEGMLR